MFRHFKTKEKLAIAVVTPTFWQTCSRRIASYPLATTSARRMELHRLGARTLIAAALLIGAAAPAAAQDRERAAACELGREILDRKPAPVLLLPGPFEKSERAQLAPLREGAPQGRPPPSAALAWAWSRAPASNLIEACPELLDGAKVRLAGPADMARSETFQSADLRPVERYTAPVFDAAFTEALVGYGYQCPGLCGGELIFYFRRIDGRWVLQYPWMLWIS